MQNPSRARNDSVYDSRSSTNGQVNGHTHTDQKSSRNEWQDAVKEQRPAQSDAASMTSTRQHNGQGNGLVSTGSMSNGVADFFSPEIFQIVLHNPTTSHQLLQFSQSRFCGENMEFLEKVGSKRDCHHTIYRTVLTRS